MASITTITPKLPDSRIDDTSNIYYNIRIVNDSKSLFKTATYSVTRTAPIVDKPDDYELAVVRFSVPASNIPIMVWGDTPYDVKTNPSSKVDKFSVSMTFDGATVTKFLQFYPNTTGNDFYGNTVWNYTEFVQSINGALADAFIDMKIAKPAAPPTTAPFMIYNSSNRLCSLLAPQTYLIGLPYEAPIPATVQVYFNTALYTYFPSIMSFEQEELDPLSHQILFQNQGDNLRVIGAVTYIEIVQEYSTLALWSDFTTIVFETDTIPVEPEYQPSQNDTTRRLITDFEPLEDINNREKFQYFGSGWKRYYDLRSSYPMREIDIKAYWEDRDGKLYPIYLGADEALTMKILFRKKLPLQLANALYGTADD